MSKSPDYADPNDPRWPDDAQRREIEDEAGPIGNGLGAYRAAADEPDRESEPE